MKKLSFILFIFCFFCSALATVTESVLNAKQLQKYIAAMPDMKKRYSKYEGLLGTNGEQASANIKIEHQVKVLKVHGLYQEFSNEVKALGFSSAELFLTTQLRIALGMGRLSMERLYGKPLEQMAILESIVALAEDKETHSNSVTEIAAMLEAMSIVSEDELNLVREHETQLAPFFYSPPLLPFVK